jgi:acyl transferase domain-containing protein
VSGVNVIEDPELFYRMSSLGFLSPDSKCYSFDHRANGYSRGEGVGTVIIKPLRAALRDGNTIRAIVRGTGVNSDGRTPGITMPSKDAQEALIKDVYSKAGLEPKYTGFVEAHGTGTPAGDPVEAGAIAMGFSSRESSTPLYIGALKSNVGHMEGASGVAGLIKSVMILEKGIIPPNINFEKANPRILEKEWNIAVGFICPMIYHF